MRVIYIAGPFRGVTTWAIAQHVYHAETLAYAVAALGAMPLCPHTNTAHSQGLQDDQFWLDGTLELMSRCDAVMVTDDWKDSEGARAEVVKAHQLNIPVFFELDRLRAWLTKDVNQ